MVKFCDIQNNGTTENLHGVKEVRGTSAGCKGTWKYFNPNIRVPLMSKMTNFERKTLHFFFIKIS